MGNAANDKEVKKALESESKNKEIPVIKEEIKKEEKKPESTTETKESSKPEEVKPEEPKEAEPVKNESPAPEPAPQPAPQPEASQPAPTEQKRNWMPVYRTGHHDAITHTRAKYVSSDRKFVTYDIEEMDNYIFEQADKDIFVSYTSVTETVVDKEAWDEQVLDHYQDTYTGETRPL